MIDLISTIITFIVNTFITALAYLVVPTFFCAIGYSQNRSYSLKTIKRIVLINGASVWLTFQIISISLGEFGVSAAVFIWSGLAYWLMRKILYKKSADSTPENDNKIEFEIVNKNDKKRNLKAPFAIVAILLSLSFTLNLLLLGITVISEDNTEFEQELEQELEQAEEQNRKLEQELQQDHEKLDFFDEHIVVVEDDNTGWYHKYECYRFRGDYFWAYNIENAESLGYKPCPECCK